MAIGAARKHHVHLQASRDQWSSIGAIWRPGAARDGQSPAASASWREATTSHEAARETLASHATNVYMSTTGSDSAAGGGVSDVERAAALAAA